MMDLWQAALSPTGVQAASSLFMWGDSVGSSLLAAPDALLDKVEVGEADAR
ncbi:unnamed protein product [marine sediment metagenome]|uniref:Uncharacterized protein n=1 Tax=marine sediment metagenome TaxID=412755 RepID=X1SIH2_9ZZZZ